MKTQELIQELKEKIKKSEKKCPKNIMEYMSGKGEEIDSSLEEVQLKFAKKLIKAIKEDFDNATIDLGNINGLIEGNLIRYVEEKINLELNKILDEAIK